MPDFDGPSAARMYDYYIGGTYNFPADREAADRVAAALPEIKPLALENRAFLRRAVRYVARQGITQFIDIGSGLPTVGNTHEIAQSVVPDARVVYADLDPLVAEHGAELLSDDARTAVVTADMRTPEPLFEKVMATGLIDPGAPTGVLMVAMIHFLTLEDRATVMGYLRRVLAPGSYLIATHITADGKPPESAAGVEAVYKNTPTPAFFRPHAEIAPFFDGFDLVPPGLVTPDRWHPDPAPDATGWLYVAVGRRNPDT